MTTTTLDSQRFQRIHPPSVGNIYIRGQDSTADDDVIVSADRSSRRFTFTSLDRWWQVERYPCSGACVSHYADCRSAADTGSRVNVNHRDPPICWRDPQNKVLIHTYRICIECEPS